MSRGNGDRSSNLFTAMVADVEGGAFLRPWLAARERDSLARWLPPGRS